MPLYKEDVYETEDIQLPDPDDMKEDFENNKEIEKIHIDLNGAKKRFVNCILDPRNADFSDYNATTRLKRGYKASEIFEGEPTEEESFEQKYSRICLEFKELMAESNKKMMPENVSKPEIIGIYDLLRSISSTANRSKQIIPKLKEDCDISTEWKIWFEKQINHIENTIGCDIGKNKLIDALEELKSLIGKESSEELQTKANNAYELAVKYQEICQQIPDLIRKMLCVSNLNEQVLQLTAKLNDESDIKEQLEKKYEGNKAALFELRKEMKTNLEVLFDKFDIVDEKIATFKS